MTVFPSPSRERPSQSISSHYAIHSYSTFNVTGPLHMADSIYESDLWCYVDPSAHEPGCPYALLVLNHPLRDSATVRSLWNRGKDVKYDKICCFSALVMQTDGRKSDTSIAIAAHRVAADGGANRLVPFFRSLRPARLDAIVGDLDSLTQTTRDFFAATVDPPTVVHSPDQDSTDFAKGVEYIRSRWPGLRIAVLGGLGGRVDQGLGVMHHLYMLQQEPLHSMSLILIGEGCLTVMLPPGKHALRVRPPNAAKGAFQPHSTSESSQPLRQTHVGIVPITTRGLEWDVQSWETEIGGRVSTSNRIAEGIEVVHIESTAGVLFTVHIYDDDE